MTAAMLSPVSRAQLSSKCWWFPRPRALKALAAQRPIAVGGSIHDLTVPGLLSAETHPQPSPTICETPVMTTTAMRLAVTVGRSRALQGASSPSQLQPI